MKAELKSVIETVPKKALTAIKWAWAVPAFRESAIGFITGILTRGGVSGVAISVIIALLSAAVGGQ